MSVLPPEILEAIRRSLMANGSAESEPDPAAMQAAPTAGQGALPMDMPTPAPPPDAPQMPALPPEPGSAPMPAMPAAPGPMGLPAPVQSEASLTDVVPTGVNGPGPSTDYSPGGLANLALDEDKRSADTVNRANALKSDSINQQTDLAAQEAAMEGQAAQHKADYLRNDFMPVQEAVNQWIQTSEMKSLAESEASVEERRQFYRDNPTNFWGSRTDGQKVAAVIGMIGAGMSGESSSKYIDSLINRTVQEQMRGEERLDKLGAMEQGLAKQRMQLGTHLGARLMESKAVAYEMFGEELKAAQNMYKSSSIKASLGSAQADAQMKAEQLRQSGVQERLKTMIAAGAQAVQMRGQNMKLMAAQQRLAQKKGAQMVQVKEWAGGGIPVQGVNSEKMVETHNSRMNVLGGLEHMEQVFQQGGASPNTEMQRKKWEALLTPEIRKIVGTGATLTVEENKNVKALEASWEDFLADKIGLAELHDQLKIVRQGIASQDEQDWTTVSNGESNPAQGPAPGTPLYRALKERDEDNAKSQADAEEVQAVINDASMSDAAKGMKLFVLSKRNPLAKRIYDETHGGSSMFKRFTSGGMRK